MHDAYSPGLNRRHAPPAGELGTPVSLTWIWTRIHVNINTHWCEFKHVFMWIRTCISININTHSCKYRHIYIYWYQHELMWIWTHFMWICRYVSINTNMYLCHYKHEIINTIANWCEHTHIYSSMKISYSCGYLNMHLITCLYVNIDRYFNQHKHLFV